MLSRFEGNIVLLSLVAIFSWVRPAAATVIGPDGCVGQGSRMCPGTVQDLSYGSDPLVVIATTGPEAITGLDSSSNTVWTADLQQWVVRDLSTNTLDFWYFVDVTAGPQDVAGVTSNGFTGFTTDVGVTCASASTQGPCQMVGVTPGAVSPDFIARSASGDSLTFAFLESGPELRSFSLSPSKQPYLLVINTDATAYTTGTTSLTGGGGIGTGSTFAPSAVPEPANLVSILSGLFMAGLLARRRGA
jgi:hypothetical protein